MSYLLYGRELQEPGLGIEAVTGKLVLNRPLTERAGRVVLEDQENYYVALASAEDDGGLGEIGEFVEIPDRLVPYTGLAALAPPIPDWEMTRRLGRMVFQDQDSYYVQLHGPADRSLDGLGDGETVFIPSAPGGGLGDLGGWGFFKKIWKGAKKAVKKVGRGLKKAAKKIGKVTSKVWKKGKKYIVGGALIAAGVVAGATGVGLPVAGALVGAGAGLMTGKGTGFGKPKEWGMRAGVGAAIGGAVGAAIAYAPAILAGAKTAGGGIMAAGKWVGSGLLSAGGKLWQAVSGGSLLSPSQLEAGGAGGLLPGTLAQLGDKIFGVQPNGSGVEIGPAGGGGEGGGGGGGVPEAAEAAAPPDKGWAGLSTGTKVAIGAGAVLLLVLLAKD
jgi:hypothetical protein